MFCVAVYGVRYLTLKYNHCCGATEGVEQYFEETDESVKRIYYHVQEHCYR